MMQVSYGTLQYIDRPLLYKKSSLYLLLCSCVVDHLIIAKNLHFSAFLGVITSILHYSLMHEIHLANKFLATGCQNNDIYI